MNRKSQDWSYCPVCGGEVDTGYECNKCGRDWIEFHQTKAQLLDAHTAQLVAKDREIERLTGVLDIIQRENAGEADDWLAVEYGGTGYENHPACVSTRQVRAQLTAQVGEAKDITSANEEEIFGLRRRLESLERDGWQTAIAFIQGGSFLHADAPDAKFARQLVAAMKRHKYALGGVSKE